MLSFTLSFLCGILFLQSFTSLPSNTWTAGCLLICIFLKFRPAFTKNRPLQLWMMGSLLGFAWVVWYANDIMRFTLPTDMEGKTIIVQGEIISLPRVFPHQTSFLFHLKPHLEEKMSDGIIRLTWRKPSIPLQVGDEWQLAVRLKKIHSTMNPGGYDYEAWAFENSIRAQGYIVEKEHPLLIAKHHYLHFINRLRQYIQEQAERYLPPTQTSSWIIALMLGERNGIPPSEWEVLRNTGTNHLMAIAGLHIGFMSGMAYTLTVWLWRRLPSFMLALPAYQAGACASLITALAYSALAGFSIPTQRASIMISVFLLTTFFKRVIPPWQAWTIALFVVLLLNPLSVLSSSFWLSFGTLALIIYGMSGRLAPQGWWWKWGRPQWVIAVGLLPLSLWLFTQYSLVSFVANTIAIPWVGFLVLPLCFLSVILLCICPLLAKGTLSLADHSLSVLWYILTWLSHLSWASWNQTIPHYGLLIAAVLGIVILLSPSGFPGKYLGLLWLLPVLTFKPSTPSFGEAKFSLLDVGQGLSAVVQTQHHALVFDTGAHLSLDFDMGESVVIPFLHSQGIKQLDMLVISHGDNDHSGGASAILKQLPVLSLRTSVPQLFLAWKADYCLLGTSWDWDGVHFAFLHPSLNQLNLGNNSSCVLKISTPKHHILLAGDIEKEAEKYLLRHHSIDLHADIIVAPHHGSKTSGLPDFIDQVNPQYVLYAIGYRNRYHFPHPSVVSRYHALGVTSYDTAVCGAIQFTIGQNSISLPTLYRIKHQKYWNETSKHLPSFFPAKAGQ